MRKLSTALLLLTAGLAGADERGPSVVPGTVTLPLGEYERLLERAQQPHPASDPAPVAAALGRAGLHLTVGAARVHGSFEIDGEVFAAGLTRVPLLRGATLLGARASGKPVALLDDSGSLEALLPGPRPFALQLDWVAPVVSEPGRASFQVPVPRAGSVEAVIELPGEQAEVRLEPGLITARSASGGTTRIEATLEPGTNTRVSWTAREAAQVPAREARLLAQVETLASVGEAELQLSVLVDVTVVEGEVERLELAMPPDFELTGVTGSTLESAAEAPGSLTLLVREPERRRHQFLLSLRRATEPGSFSSELPFVSVEGAQRESGELAIGGLGALELAARESGTLRRMDVSEAAAALRALAREPLLQAFRYQRRKGEGPALTLEVTRFEPQAVLAALCEQATATTLVTAEGRTLTEVKLRVRNQAQPFVKLGLPEGATLLSAEVAGQGVKPVQGQDGTRVPLLRSGFRPSGAYEVSFVYLQPGAPFGKRGQAQLSLPRLDLPVSLLEWELFLPDSYRVKNWGGNALRQDELYLSMGFEGGVPGGIVGGVAGGALGGVVGGLPADGDARPRSPSATAEIEVGVDQIARSKVRQESDERQALNAPSENVFALQKRVAGVLPVSVDVPRAGESFRFVRPLVLDEETSVSFQYKAR